MSEAHSHEVAAGGEENPFAGQGAVLLDIGGDIGAIVVEMPAQMVGVEIEVRPVSSERHLAGHLAGQHRSHHGEHTHHPHVAVVDRQAPDGTVPSLVFPELREGTYELAPKGGGPANARAVVRGNQVTQLTWPA